MMASHHSLTLFICCLALSVAVVSADFAPASIEKDEKSITLRSREDQIHFWEGRLDTIRRGWKAGALNDLFRATEALGTAKKHSSWLFKSSDEKARLRLLDEEVAKQTREVQLVSHQEDLLIAKLKPLYGIVSRHFVQEQRNVIADSIKEVQRMSYDNAWYSSLFNLRDADSITDVIVGFLFEWLMGYIIMYPFAFLYYALWQAPTSIYAYMSGSGDIVMAVLAWLCSVTIMALPLLALGLGGFIFLKKYGEDIRMARERTRHPHSD